MLDYPPTKFRRRRRPVRRRPAVGPAAQPPVLVAAVYEEVGAVTLTFDRPVDASAVAPGSVAVADVALMSTFVSTGGVTAAGPETVTLALAEGEPYFGEGFVLTASNATGIVAAAGGAMWAGVSGVELPYP